MTLLPWNWLKMTVSAKKSLIVLNILQMKCIGHVLETRVKNSTARFCNHSTTGMRSYLIKSKFKVNLQKHHFVYVYEVIIKCNLNFITCLYFPLALFRWNSSHCHLMELFKSKEICRKNLIQTIIEKLHGQRMILEWHLFLRLSLEFLWKMLIFVRKNLNFYPKDVSSFSVFFISMKRS